MKKQICLILSLLIMVVSLPLSAGAAPATVEETLLNGFDNLDLQIDVARYKITSDDFWNIYIDLLTEHPEYFYVRTELKWTYNISDGTVTSILPVYIFGPDEIKAKKAAFDAAVDKALESVKDCTTDEQKVIALHDYLIMNAEYDVSIYSDTQATPYESYTAYGVLVDGLGVCQSYSLAYKALLNKVGIRCGTATNKAETHIWNVVELGGVYYHVDVTFDDPLLSDTTVTGTTDTIGTVNHKYLLKSDSALLAMNDYAHKDGWNTDYRCPSTKYDNAWWRTLTSCISFVGGNLYYTESVSSTNAQLKKAAAGSNILSAAASTATGIAGNWNNYSAYARSFAFDGKIYYNSDNAIYCYYPETGNIEKKFTATFSGNQKIFGIAEYGGYLIYTVKASPASPENIRQAFKLEKQVPVITTAPTTQPTTPATTVPSPAIDVDFAVSETGAVSDDLYVGELTPLFAVVRNNGSDTYSGEVTVNFAVAGSTVDVMTVNITVESGKSVVITSGKEWEADLGSWSVRADINYKKTVVESSYANNGIKSRISVVE